MHYRNGREAKNGDKIVRLNGGYIDSIGILHDAKPESGDYCRAIVSSGMGRQVMKKRITRAQLEAENAALKAHVALLENTIKALTVAPAMLPPVASPTPFVSYSPPTIQPYPWIVTQPSPFLPVRESTTGDFPTPPSITICRATIQNNGCAAPTTLGHVAWTGVQ